MIRIEFTGDASTVLGEMKAMIEGIVKAVDPAPINETGAGPKVEAEEKPAAPKPRKAPAKAEPEAAPAATAPAEPAAQTSKEKDAPSDFDVEGVDPANKDSVRAYLSQSIDILTGAVVTQVFSEFGATKFGEVKPEQYAAMIVRLDELRKAKEAEEA